MFRSCWIVCSRPDTQGQHAGEREEQDEDHRGGRVQDRDGHVEDHAENERGADVEPALGIGLGGRGPQVGPGHRVRQLRRRAGCFAPRRRSSWPS